MDLIREMKFTLRIEEDLLERLKIMAYDETRSTNGEIIDLIKNALMNENLYKHKERIKPLSETNFYLRIDNILMDDLREMAKKHKNSINTEIVQIIEYNLEIYESQFK